MTRVLLVGEMNPYGADPEMALYHLPIGASGDRLRRILGLSAGDYLGLERANLCVGKWSIRAARERVTELQCDPDRLFVLLGRRVAQAFACGWPFFAGGPVPVRGTMGGVVVAASLPHPSGLNLIWNEPGSVQRARDLLRRMAPSIAWGSHDERPVDGGWA